MKSTGTNIELNRKEPATVQLAYPLPDQGPQRRVALAFLLAACFAAGYLVAELLIWVVLFYEFHCWHDEAVSLMHLKRFIASYLVEVFLAGVGASIVALVFSLFKTGTARINFTSICFLSAGLGGIKTAIPWILIDGLHLLNGEKSAFVLAALLPLLSALLLVYTAYYQARLNSLASESRSPLSPSEHAATP